MGLFCLPGSCQAQSARAGMTQSPGDAASTAAYFKPSCLEKWLLGLSTSRGALQRGWHSKVKLRHSPTIRLGTHHHCLRAQQSLSTTQGASSKRGSAPRNTPGLQQGHCQ